MEIGNAVVQNTHTHTHKEGFLGLSITAVVI